MSTGHLTLADGLSPTEARRMRSRLATHAAVFRGFVATAAEQVRAGQVDAACAWAQIAADHAWRNHTGLFVSPELERQLLAIGAGLPDRCDARPDRGRSPERVLHVLTQALGVGGHTRLVWRWIEHDTARAHSVVLTRQITLPVPAGLVAAVRRSGGTLRHLDRRLGGLTARALALRDAARAYDRVVLHPHPYDAVPLVAFGRRDAAPPVIHMNHADHVFWLGVGVADLFANIRESGRSVAARRRMVAAERLTVLPICVGRPERVSGRAEAKRRLGIQPETLVLLSVASAYKYVPSGEVALGDAVAPLLAAHPAALLLVAGPAAGLHWERAAARSGERIRLLGVCEDLRVLYEAADLYLDSFPFGSLTSLLEAGTYGLPLLAYTPYSKDSEVLACDAPGLARSLVASREMGAYQATLRRFMNDRELREDVGGATRTEIEAMHTGEGWRRALEETYSAAAALPPTGPLLARRDEHRDDDLDVMLTHLQERSGVSGPPEERIQAHVALLPWRQRLQAWREQWRRGRRLSARLLLSEALMRSLDARRTAR